MLSTNCFYSHHDSIHTWSAVYLMIPVNIQPANVAPADTTIIGPHPVTTARPHEPVNIQYVCLHRDTSAIKNIDNSATKKYIV